MEMLNMSNVTASGDGFESPKAGGYIAKIVSVKDVPLDANTGKGKYLTINYDFAEGDFKDYYKDMQERLSADWWGGHYIRSYKKKALPMFKRFCECVSKSNNGFVFDGGQINHDEQTLVGKYIGLLLGEEEYNANDGTVKTRLYVVREYTIEQIKAGKFKVPELKKLPTSTDSSNIANAGITDTNEAFNPFN